VTAYLLALASAALYGAADFLGGLASRRASTIAIVLVSQAAGLLPLALLLLVLPATPSAQDFIWGTIAGLAGSVGVALLYRALAIGTMSVVAPTTAVCAVILPVVVEAARGARLAPLTQGGIALAVVSIVLVSQHEPMSESVARTCSGSRGGPDEVRPTAIDRAGAVFAPPPGIGLAFASGVAIGLFFLALARTGAGAGLWPLLASRGFSMIVFGAIAVAGTQGVRMSSAVLKIAIACGVVDMLANALYLLASRGGPLSVVVTLASLYPASTVILARVVVGERLSRRQALGIVCALTAVVLIVSTS
jgi:drug/metabolite transporter (DMT)-like permease